MPLCKLLLLQSISFTENRDSFSSVLPCAAVFRQSSDVTFVCRPAPTRTGPSNDGPAEPSELPDSVIVSMLQREVLLTEAKLHALDYELVTSERKLRQLRSQLRQVSLPLSPRDRDIRALPEACVVDWDRSAIYGCFQCNAIALTLYLSSEVMPTKRNSISETPKYRQWQPRARLSPQLGRQLPHTPHRAAEYLTLVVHWLLF